MKQLYLLLITFVSFSAFAQYKGGANDGFSSTLVVTQNPLNNIYAGGNNDGFASAMVTGQNALNNIYAGGMNDGFATVVVTGQNSLNNIYAGGSNDGFASITITGQNTLNNIYAGGNDDGFAAWTVPGQNSLNNIYAGGNNDGFAAWSIPGQNPLNNIYAGGSNDGFATLFVANQNPLSTLPVRLSTFSGRWQQEDIALWWITANETNTDHFEVERSMDNAGNFVQIGTVQAAGNSSTDRRYDLLDNTLPANGSVFYYRLKTVDIDGHASYSAIIRFTRDAKEVTYTIYPNPGTGLFNINIGGVSDFKNYTYRVMNGNGSLTAQGNIVAANTQFDISRMPAGVYYVQLINLDKTVTTYKIILQH